MFCLLAICSFVFFWSRKTGIPYTVLLVLVGIVLVLITKISFLSPVFGFLTSFPLTPELLFYVFLPTLIFESAFNMNIRKIVDNVWSISILSVIGLVISSVCIAVLMHFILPLIGLNIPFIVLLLFASIISATDPVAVLALFKEYGAPKRLTLIFEGESLFNDGTAVALFLVVLAVAQKGYHGFETILGGIETFMMMIFLGIFFGVLVAMLFTKFLKYFKNDDFISITLLVVSAHIIFILSELVNLNPIFGVHLHISPIIATTFGGLFLGNYARHILSPKNEEYLEKSIAHLAFIINSLVFIMVGILLTTTPLNLKDLLVPTLVTILIVATSRAISVYSSIIPLNKMKLEENIPNTWQHLLSWGSLRGALAIIIVLQIPNDFMVEGWSLAYSPKEFLVAITAGCILATLFIKATTIKKFMDKFNVYDNDVLEKISHLNISLMNLLNKKKKIAEHINREFVISTKNTDSEKLVNEIDAKISKVVAEKNELEDSLPEHTFINELKLDAINIEQKYLKELYDNGDIGEKVYRRIAGKLNIQREKFELQENEEINPSLHTDKKDVFDKFISFLFSLFYKDGNKLNEKEQLEYYRAQTAISRKVVKNLTELNTTFEQKIYPEKVLKDVLELYEKYKDQSNKKFTEFVKSSNPETIEHLNHLNSLAIKTSGRKSLSYIFDKGIINTHHLDSFGKE